MLVFPYTWKHYSVKQQQGECCSQKLPVSLRAIFAAQVVREVQRDRNRGQGKGLGGCWDHSRTEWEREVNRDEADKEQQFSSSSH